ncbi:cytochrome c oxidase assembly factor Coa1 family protein [Hyalangium rubrum]|uniref:Cytochrome c oxidase assembly factor Coa1 family protein n=1 Tax=Hyalangium rubrum TaxID=3103134 RepID=A0ABU5HEN1_9BACT|nr:cytochrome c oxidase assembly factor Coa1 family protein [Hyalangium sp. s54d21]MDY7231935.1 cytochrome c oxidase assembly factor Coa1 family protein [Hyalangium sp. s54d21]
MTPEGNLAPQPSWWSRNWKWAVPVGCLGVLASCGCLGALIFGVAFSAVKNNMAYEQAVNIATTDDEVQAVLGTPITTGMPSGAVNSMNGRSSAELAIPLDGPKEDGVLRIEATKQGEEWDYSMLQVEVPGREPIDLRDRVGGGTPRELAPPTPDAPPPPPPPPGVGDAPHIEETGEERPNDINL